MFGVKMLAKSKTKKFAGDKDRKRYYAIQGYYKKKKSSVFSDTKGKNGKSKQKKQF